MPLSKKTLSKTVLDTAMLNVLIMSIADKPFKLCVVMLNAVMLSVDMPNAVMLRWSLLPLLPQRQ